MHEIFPELLRIIRLIYIIGANEGFAAFTSVINKN